MHNRKGKRYQTNNWILKLKQSKNQILIKKIRPALKTSLTNSDLGFEIKT